MGSLKMKLHECGCVGWWQQLVMQCFAWLGVAWWRCLTRNFVALLLLYAAIGWVVPALADYRDSPAQKLAAAKTYVEQFLKEDARPDQVFFARDVHFPVWKDQAIHDCAMKSIVRAVRSKEPYFEDRKERIVVVPVWVELLMAEVSNDGGPEVTGREGESQCTFEYERYSFETNRFEKISTFRKRTHGEEFKYWGESMPSRDKLYRTVAVDLPLRYVRFNFRVSVAQVQPYQLLPQIPRHYLADAAIAKLQSIRIKNESRLAQGISDRDPTATGQALSDDLERMKSQDADRRWMVMHLQSSLEQLHNIPSFGEVK